MHLRRFFPVPLTRITQLLNCRPHAPCDVPYAVPVLGGCWLIGACKNPIPCPIRVFRTGPSRCSSRSLVWLFRHFLNYNGNCSSHVVQARHPTRAVEHLYPCLCSLDAMIGSCNPINTMHVFRHCRRHGHGDGFDLLVERPRAGLRNGIDRRAAHLGQPDKHHGRRQGFSAVDARIAGSPCRALPCQPHAAVIQHRQRQRHQH